MAKRNFGPSKPLSEEETAKAWRWMGIPHGVYTSYDDDYPPSTMHHLTFTEIRERRLKNANNN